MALMLQLLDGTQCRVTTMLDCDGDETQDPEQAHVVVAEMPDGKWIVHEVGPDMWVPETKAN